LTDYGPRSPDADLVSVIVPAYNASRTIERTLRSASAQSHRLIEIIVVDDGSTDRTAEIVTALAYEDKRILLLRQPNGGVAVARNLAISRARGNYIAPLDADDLWHPDKIALQLQALQDASASTGFAYCWSVGIDDDDRVTSNGLIPFPSPRFEGNVLAELVTHNIVGGGSVPLIRRSLLHEVGGYDPELRRAGGQACEDWKLYILLAERSEFIVVPRTLVGYRQHLGHSSMSMNLKQTERSNGFIVRWTRQKFPDLPKSLFRHQLYYVYSYLALQALRQGAMFAGVKYMSVAALNNPRRLLAAPVRIARRYPNRPGQRKSVESGIPFAALK